jgi:hypothetical protein
LGVFREKVGKATEGHIALFQEDESPVCEVIYRVHGRLNLTNPRNKRRNSKAGEIGKFIRNN